MNSTRQRTNAINPPNMKPLRRLSSQMKLHSEFTLALLDGPRLSIGNLVVDLPSRSHRLVSLLALRGPLPRSLAAGYLWPEASESRARTSVRAAVRDLQQRVPSLLQATTTELRLNDAVRVDVRRLRELCRELLLPLPNNETLHGGLGLLPDGWLGGHLLPGWHDEWVVAEAERLHQLRLHALDSLANHFLTRQHYAQALQVALATISVDPLRESTHRAAMRIFLAEGNIVEALRQYERFRALVIEAVGIEPSEQMVDLVDEITTSVDQGADQ
jgi:DNA-binding SARP family transcriptional activator